MSFENLPGVQLQLPQYHFQPTEVRPRPNIWPGIIQGIAQLAKTAEDLSPDGQQRKRLENAELRYNTAKLEYALNNSDVAFGGKNSLDQARIDLMRAQKYRIENPISKPTKPTVNPSVQSIWEAHGLPIPQGGLTGSTDTSQPAIPDVTSSDDGTLNPDDYPPL